MGHESSPRSLRSRLGRGAVLLSSGSLAALLVSRSGPGCGGASSVDASTPAAAPAAAAPAAPSPAAPTSEPGKAQPPPVNAPPQPAPQPAAADAQPREPGPIDGKAAKNDAGDPPRYFPASKAGVFVEIKQEPQPQAGPR